MVFGLSERSTSNVLWWISPFLSLFLYVWFAVIMEVEESDLTPETIASTLMEERIH